MKRRLAAILYADIAGYSRLVDADEEGIYPIFRTHFDALRTAIQAHGGRVVNTAGDAILAEFESVVTALRCAVAAQHDLEDRNCDLADERKVQFRIGVNFGDVIIDRDELYGNGVNVAARLEALAEAGGICISGRVLEQVEKNVNVGFAFLGWKHVKNIEEPVDAYKVLRDPEHAGKIIGRSVPLVPTLLSKSGSQWLALASLALLVGGGALWWWSSRPDLPPVPAETMAFPFPDRPSIAILPFDNLNDNPEQNYFAAGLTDDLITELSKVSGLFVIARHSVFSFEETEEIQEVAAALGVQYVLEGTLRHTGSRVRINAQLIDASTGRYMWAERYDRDYADLFVLQDDVIDHIISAMAVQLTTLEKEQLARIPTDNLEAYDNYLRAEQEGFYFSDVETYRRALSYYQQAIKLDPNFADAHAGIARVAVDVWRNDYNLLWSAAVARKIAYDAAGRALTLDPNNARAHGVLALLQMVDGRTAEAIASARRAVTSKPNDAEAHGTLGLVLVSAGDLSQGVAEIEAALRLDPTPAPNFRLLAGVVFYTGRHYEQAIAQLEPARDALPQAEPAHEYLAPAYAYHGDQDLAGQEIQRLLELFPATNLAYYEALYDYWSDEQRRHHVEGLRRAGLSRWPFAFEGHDRDRLNAHELADLTTDKTWIGRHKNGTPFAQQFDHAGNVAYQSANTFTTGTAHLRGDMLCQRLDGFPLDQPMCGYVYRSARRSADESAEAGEDYVHVSPDALKYFTLEK